jgi:hypothetical protein
MPCQSNPPWFYHPNNIWWRVQVMKLPSLSSFLQPPLCCVQILSSMSCLPIPSTYVLHLVWNTKFHTQTKRKINGTLATNNISERKLTYKNCWMYSLLTFSWHQLLCLNWAPRHEGVLGEWRYSSTHSSTSALRFTPRERAPSTHWIGGWMGPIASQDAVAKRKILSPCRDSNPQSFSP